VLAQWYVERELGADTAPELACAGLRRLDSRSVFLDGRGFADGGWGGPLVAVAPRLVLWHRRAGVGPAEDAFERLERLHRSRRVASGGRDTGLVALLAYDLLDPSPVAARDDDGLPELVVLAVDAAIRFGADGAPRYSARLDLGAPRQAPRVATLARKPMRGTPTRLRGRPRSSLPRERYLAAVVAVQEHIRAGDIYQANLTQRFVVRCREDSFELYRHLIRGAGAPRSAFVDTGRWALASVSPETFLRVVPGGVVQTWPIKGTRPRSTDPRLDHRNALELVRSEKDRAELTMIVDLERNDLGRVCETGSVRVVRPAGLVSFPAVHHLVATVTGRLRRGAGPAELLRATFPGGSITGAPKLRAMEILRGLEPVRRSFFTGSLVWLGDDGQLDSSILIRSVVLTRGRALLGAGGGVVADSDPEAEWRESNDKARPLAEVLGFEPEEAC
jgi:anthranilate/para-aminobenzoate synthase component I